MSWEVKFSREAKKSLTGLDKSVQRQVMAGIKKVGKNPLPSSHGYGKPLGNKKGHNLTGFFKIKYRDTGIRVVYSIATEYRIMNILVVSERDDDYCYKVAMRLYEKYGEDVFKDMFDGLE